MFQWDKDINGIEVDAGKVLHLFKSMREVQLAHPGVSAQESSAYLCQYVHENGVATVAAFHLHTSNIIAFYRSDPFVVPVSKADGKLDEGLNFVESMGFLLTDQDIHLLEEADQKMLWESLPLKAGIQENEVEDSPAAAPEQTVVAPTVKEEKAVAPEPAAPKEQAAEEVKAPVEKVVDAVTEKASPEPAEDVAENVDDLLAAVEAMRAKRPGLRARKAMPSADDMARRKQELRENIGRILASQ